MTGCGFYNLYSWCCEFPVKAPYLGTKRAGITFKFNLVIRKRVIIGVFKNERRAKKSMRNDKDFRKIFKASNIKKSILPISLVVKHFMGNESTVPLKAYILP